MDAEGIDVTQPAKISQEDWEYFRDRVRAHDAELKAFRRMLTNIQLGVDELSKWKEDSKVTEIAALKGQIKRYSRVRDRILYLLASGAILEGVRLMAEHWIHK